VTTGTIEEHEHELEQQLRSATAALREAVLRLLRAGEVDPRLIVLAAARVTGELGAAAALAGGEDVEGLVNELAEVVRQAGRGQHAALRAETLPVAGNA
jgi:hypothetical protein